MMETRKELPKWLHDHIYNKMGSHYQPDRQAAQDNLLSTDDENRRYLGTYFPRSFTESYCIFSNLFKNKAYLDQVRNKDSLNILSFGCGTGGDLIGLLESVADNLPWIKNIDFTAFDGNFNAIGMLKGIVDQYIQLGRFNIRRRDYSPFPMNGRADFDLTCRCLTQGYDLICSLKMVNELYRHNVITIAPFKTLLDSIAPKLSREGVMLCLDVPIRVKGEYMPALLSSGLRGFLAIHAEYEAIVPIPCHRYGRNCIGRCYPTQHFYGNIFGSEIVTYTIVARSEMANAIITNVPKAQYLINKDNECCRCAKGQMNISIYDINMI